MSRSGKKFIVGLTGGIGSGKSTVADMFRARGVDVIDADEISRRLVEKGSPALIQIAEHFGPDVLDGKGNLDRSRLRQIIFNDPAEKKWLEGLLHPRVREEIRQAVDRARSPYVLLVVPLLLESGQYEFVDRVLVVDMPESLQIDRTANRDGTDRREVEAIMATQLSREKRLQRADDVIDNSGTLEILEQEVSNLHDFYRQQVTDDYQKS